MANLLIADDEQGYRDVLKVIFEDRGHDVRVVKDGRSALELLKTRPFDAVISDVRMPDMGGIEFLRAAREFYPDIGIILMTAFGTIDTAREAFKLGADDFLAKPFNNEELMVILERTLERKALVNENRALKRAQRNSINIIGTSPAMQQLQEEIETVAREEATVLITGESGSGKELVARAIHQLSNRADKPFIPINCGAMTETLLESELFGFVKGAFTGAIKSQPGVFESADQGSIFLDEIGDMTAAMQVKVLRVLQERKVRRIGSAAETAVDTRVIAATNRELMPMVKDGSFRQDLYYRVSVIPLHVPPLRDRREDIPELVKHFANRFASRSGKTISISEEALAILTNRRWDGNVRELENAVERAVAFTASGDSILPEHCTDRAATNGHHSMDLPVEGLHLQACLNDLEKRYVEEALSRCSGNQKRAAELLQMPVHSLRHLLDKHGLR